jgi:hypothetical protein
VHNALDFTYILYFAGGVRIINKNNVFHSFFRPGNHLSAIFVFLLLSISKVKYFLNCLDTIYIFGTFLTLSLKLMQWYVTSVSPGSLYEKFGNKCVKILKFWRTELSYAQNKNRGKMMRLLGMDTCPSLNDIMEIRCNKYTRSEQGYDF